MINLVAICLPHEQINLRTTCRTFEDCERLVRAYEAEGYFGSIYFVQDGDCLVIDCR